MRDAQSNFDDRAVVLAPAKRPHTKYLNSVARMFSGDMGVVAFVVFLPQVNPFKMNSSPKRKLRPAVFMHNLVL